MSVVIQVIIDITTLNLEGISRIDINGDVNIPEELYINTDIVELNNVKFDGYLDRTKYWTPLT